MGLDSPPIIFTIGHSTRPLKDFIQILNAYKVGVLADIRRVPRSKHNPQFDQETFRERLKEAGLQYIPMPGLGGFRRAHPDSKNLAWRSPGFRGFADYMESREFEENLKELLRIANQKRTSVMCAEALPWRCHRSLLADALTIRGLQVEHILSLTQSQPHKLHPCAKVVEGVLTYPKWEVYKGLPK